MTLFSRGRNSRLACSIVFALAGMSAGLADTVILDCKMNLTSRSGGWIPGSALIEVNRSSKALTLIEPTAEQLNGRVTSAKLVREASDKMVLLWEVKGTRSSSNQTTPVFKFRAIVEKPSGKASVIAKPLGYGNDFRAKGECAFK